MSDAFDVHVFRSVDEARRDDRSDDMRLCLDALSWPQADLYTLVPDSDQRVRALIEPWGLK